MNDKVLITGASGFVGSAVARKLIEAGFSVRALVRRTSPRAHLEGLGLEFYEGDLRDRNSIDRAVAGMRYVFHVAADYRLWARDPSEIFASNVEGTRILMEAAMRAGVERVVYTSSVATIALRPDGTAADESIPLREDQGIGAYKRSKIAAERLVEAMVAERGLAAVIVNPSTPIGPCDVRPTPTGRIIVEAARGRIPAFVDTGLNLVHVDDVGRRPSRGAASRQDRRALHPRRTERRVLTDAGGYRRPGRPACAADSSALACAAADCVCRRGRRQRHGT